MKKFYTYNQEWVFGEVNQAVNACPSFSEMPWGPPFESFTLRFWIFCWKPC